MRIVDRREIDLLCAPLLRASQTPQRERVALDHFE